MDNTPEVYQGIRGWLRSKFGRSKPATQAQTPKVSQEQQQLPEQDWRQRESIRIPHTKLEQEKEGQFPTRDKNTVSTESTKGTGASAVNNAWREGKGPTMARGLEEQEGERVKADRVRKGAKAAKQELLTSTGEMKSTLPH